MIKTPLKNASNRVLLAAFLSAVLMAWLCPANAAEPLCWVRKPNQPAPAQFDTFHGESLDFRCTFTGFGALPFAGASDVRLWYQTNGMGAAWWSIPATVSSNVLSATFTPDRDPGAERLAVFFGAPSNAYAAAQVRFRNSPGATPNVLPPPDTIDWLSQLTSATNALSIDLLASLTSATNSLSTSFAPTISNTVTKSYVESLGISSGLTTNDVCNIVTNEVGVGDWHILGGAYISSGLAPDEEDHYNVPATISEISCYTNAADVPQDVSVAIYGITYDDVEDWLPVYSAILSVDSGDIGGTAGETFSELVVSSGRSEGVFSGNTVSHLRFTNGAGDIVIDVVRESRNALGLARLTDISPTVSNIVTKAYVEDLGIEAGISAETATNIAEAVGANLPYLSEDGGRVYGEVNIDSDLTSISVMADYLSVNTEAELKDTSVRGTLTLNGDGVATTNYANTAAANAVANADTTYRRTIGLTNLNQSVQYVNITDTTPSTLAISMPTDGATKDWMVYVVSVTNVTLSLPSATWWMADTAYTNDVPPATPTALWFSQVTDGIFILGRQELTEVTAP